MIVAFITGFFMNSINVNMHAVASAAYPTAMRSTGVGWASGMGRIGSIIGPVVAGLMLATGVSVSGLLCISALPAGIGSVAAFALARQKPSSQRAAPSATAALQGK